MKLQSVMVKLAIIRGKTGHGKRATFQFEYGWKKKLPPPPVKFLHAHKTTVYKCVPYSTICWQLQNSSNC